MRRTVSLLAATVLLVLPLGGCGRASSDPQDAAAIVDAAMGMTRVPAGERVPLPELAGTTLDGAPLSTAGEVGRVVVLNAWASWCPPCRKEVPLLIDAYEATDRDDVAFVGLNVSDESGAAAEFEAAAGMPYPSIEDGDGALMAAIPGLPSSGLPATVLLDRQGRVAVRIIGPVRPGQLEPLIAALVEEA